MGLAEIFTSMCAPCRSAPKSPPCPSPDKTEAKAAANASDKTIVEVLPCTDVTNTATALDPSSPSKSHAEGFAVNQVRMAEAKQRDRQDEEAEQQLILEAFGFEVQRMLGSKAWDDRAQAVAAVREKCSRNELPPGMEEARFVDACCKMVIFCLQDKVMPIYFDGLELTKLLFGELFPTFGSQEVIKTNLERILPMIIAKTADRNARSNEGTRSILTLLAKSPSVGPSAVMAHIFTPIVNHKEISAIRGRLDLIDHVISHFGFGKSTTITMQLVMGFVRPHLDATDEKVRRAAIEVTVSCYQHKGDRTLKYITNVKPQLLKLLEARFAELDQPAKNRKQTKSAQGLPAVRGGRSKPNPKKNPRESSSQPVGNISKNGNNTGFFSSNLQPLQPLPATENTLNSTSDLNSVLKDCPQLFGQGAGSHSMVMSPLSVPESETRVPDFMPGSVPLTENFEMNGDGQMGDDADLDADLMDEIEAY
eukprot:TRINITY_DN1634_c0_g1_i1.p1 TRINITY_DN1634_c0_g1~~TRINITY_DN1634_c0_g1_i1.p1  ORF type:complete len:479 (-),score=121.75 TRINITY_DN1634_c0_g1_i1:289-1725(-)